MRRVIVKSLLTLALLAANILAAAPALSAEAWKEIRSVDGGFAITFPGSPRYLTKPVGHGRPPTLAHVYVYTERSTVYGAVYLTGARDGARLFGADAILDQFQAGFARGSSGTVKSQKALLRNGVRLREARYTTESGLDAVNRTAVVGDRFYLLMVIARPEQIGHPSVDKFLSSFRLISSKGSGPMTAKAAPTRPGGSQAEASWVAPPAADDGWKQFVDQKAGFRVEAPGKLTYSKETVQDANGPLDSHRFALEAAPERYHAGYRELPGAGGERESRAVLDAERGRLIEAMKGRLTGEEPAQLAGNPGTQFRAELPNRISVVVRLFVVNNRLYEVSAATPQDRSYSETSMRFLDSFKLLKK